MDDYSSDEDVTPPESTVELEACIFSVITLLIPSRADFHPQNDSPSYDQFARFAARIKEYIQGHPYCLHSHIALANAYIPLGYPDLAAGAAYKALLLSDAVQDESDEYHEQATDALDEFVTSTPADRPYETYAPTRRGSVHDDTDDKLTATSLILEQSLLKMLVNARHQASCPNHKIES